MSAELHTFDRSPSFTDAEVKDFADMVLSVLDLQRLYFRRKDPATLAESKSAEARLRTMATNMIAEILGGSPAAVEDGTLFGPQRRGLPD